MPITTPEPISAGSTALKLDLVVQRDGTPRAKAGGDSQPAAGYGDTTSQVVQEMKATVANRTPIAADDTDTLILAANDECKGFVVANDADKVLFLGFGTDAVTASDYTFAIPAKSGLVPFGYESTRPTTYEIRGCWDTGPTGFARVTEEV